MIDYFISNFFSVRLNVNKLLWTIIHSDNNLKKLMGKVENIFLTKILLFNNNIFVLGIHWLKEMDSKLLYAFCYIKTYFW